MTSVNNHADLDDCDAEEMLIKAQLVAKLAEFIAARSMTQQQAAKQIGLSQPKLSQILKGRFRGVSEAKLMECLTRLGSEVKIVVSTPREDSPARPVHVVFEATA